MAAADLSSSSGLSSPYTPSVSALHRERASQNSVRFGFQDNDTVFGCILRGELPAKILYEDETVLAFLDIAPASTLHAQIIPKRRIRHAGFLSMADVPLIDHMVNVAAQIAAANDVDFRAARENGSLSLGFHLPPFRSVDHLHLHAIWPMENRSCMGRLKHPPPDVLFWKISPETARRLAAARTSTGLREVSRRGQKEEGLL
jgi:histidine triad (HIT) family protein